MGVMDIIEEMVSVHFGKYSSLFTKNQDDNFYTADSRDS